MTIRTSGILLHPTCLPNQFGIGDLGPAAYRFADLLVKTGQQYWQILPASPTDPEHGHSPYHSTSSFAGDPLWISPELLAEQGWVTVSDLAEVPDFPADRVDFPRVRAFKKFLLEKAFSRFEKGKERDQVAHFLEDTPWLSDFALFQVLTWQYGGPWSAWPQPIRDRNPGSLKEASQHFSISIWREVFFSIFSLSSGGL